MTTDERYMQKKIEQLKTENSRLLEALHEFATQYHCGCGHPACNACERDRMAQDAIAKSGDQETAETAILAEATSALRQARVLIRQLGREYSGGGYWGAESDRVEYLIDAILPKLGVTSVF